MVKKTNFLLENQEVNINKIQVIYLISKNQLIEYQIFIENIKKEDISGFVIGV